MVYRLLRKMRRWGTEKREMGRESIVGTVSVRDVDGAKYMLDGMQLIAGLIISILFMKVGGGRDVFGSLVCLCIRSNNLTNVLICHQSSHVSFRN